MFSTNTFGNSIFTSSNATNTVLSGYGSTPNPMKDIEFPQPPDDAISSLAFNPTITPNAFLAAGSWDNMIRVWEVTSSGGITAKACQSHTGPVLDVNWSEDSTKIFTASADKTAKIWDLGSNQTMQIAQHDAPIKTCHWIKGNNYSCLMTGSWDKTLKFWDPRTTGTPIHTIQMPERVYCADVVYPMAVVGTANRQIIVYQLENQPIEFKRLESPLKFQSRCVSIFCDMKNPTPSPNGFAIGSIEGRVAIQYVNQPKDSKDNFTFKCHRNNGAGNAAHQDIYAVNSIAFHPKHGTLSTVGSDGRYSFWDKDARTKLKTSEQLDQPITACCFNKGGEIFAYASSYDWSKGHEGNDSSKKPHIFIRSCFEELKPSQKKS